MNASHDNPSVPERVSAYVDGELDGAALEQFEQELAGDPQLARHVEQVRRLRALVGAEESESPPGDFADRVLAEARRRGLLAGDPPAEAIEDEPADRQTLALPAWTRPLAAAALFLVAAGVGFVAVHAIRPGQTYPPASQTPAPTGELARDLSGDQVSDLRPPTDGSGLTDRTSGRASKSELKDKAETGVNVAGRGRGRLNERIRETRDRIDGNVNAIETIEGTPEPPPADPGEGLGTLSKDGRVLTDVGQPTPAGRTETDGPSRARPNRSKGGIPQAPPQPGRRRSKLADASAGDDPSSPGSPTQEVGSDESFEVAGRLHVPTENLEAGQQVVEQLLLTNGVLPLRVEARLTREASLPRQVQSRHASQQNYFIRNDVPQSNELEYLAVVTPDQATRVQMGVEDYVRQQVRTQLTIAAEPTTQAARQQPAPPRRTPQPRQSEASPPEQATAAQPAEGEQATLGIQVAQDLASQIQAEPNQEVQRQVQQLLAASNARQAQSATTRQIAGANLKVLRVVVTAPPNPAEFQRQLQRAWQTQQQLRRPTGNSAPSSAPAP